MKIKSLFLILCISMSVNAGETWAQQTSNGLFSAQKALRNIGSTWVDFMNIPINSTLKSYLWTAAFPCAGWIASEISYKRQVNRLENAAIEKQKTEAANIERYNAIRLKKHYEYAKSKNKTHVLVPVQEDGKFTVQEDISLIDLIEKSNSLAHIGCGEFDGKKINDVKTSYQILKEARARAVEEQPDDIKRHNARGLKKHYEYAKKQGKTHVLVQAGGETEQDCSLDDLITQSIGLLKINSVKDVKGSYDFLAEKRASPQPAL